MLKIFIKRSKKTWKIKENLRRFNIVYNNKMKPSQFVSCLIALTYWVKLQSHIGQNIILKFFVICRMGSIFLRISVMIPKSRKIAIFNSFFFLVRHKLPQISWHPNKLWINRPTIVLWFLDSLNAHFWPFMQEALILFAFLQKNFFLVHSNYGTSSISPK